ncbi:MAG: hypothetical protein GY941_21745 [Planctomycetes bacterium]|nr:hypothetical protein [Planctomycetota bacterium]
MDVMTNSCAGMECQGRPADEGQLRFRKARPIVSSRTKIGRNQLCCCGSGMKYKKCCQQNIEKICRSASYEKV